MAKKPTLSELADAQEEALDKIETAYDIGSYFAFPELDRALEQGALVKVFDRTNAVFVLILGRREVDGVDPAAPNLKSHLHIPEEDIIAISPRNMHLIAGLADLEARLTPARGQDGLKLPVALTGAPDDHDGLENHISYSSSTLRITKQAGLYRLALSGTDYDRMHQPGWDRTQPDPEYTHVFEAPTFEEAYRAAASFGKSVRDLRYTQYGRTPPYTVEI
jgi:hypothetical protein